MVTEKKTKNGRGETKNSNKGKKNRKNIADIMQGVEHLNIYGEI